MNNINKQYFCFDFGLFSYNIKFKVDEYVKLKLIKINFKSQYIYIYIYKILSKKLKIKNK